LYADRNNGPLQIKIQKGDWKDTNVVLHIGSLDAKVSDHSSFFIFIKKKMQKHTFGAYIMGIFSFHPCIFKSSIFGH
jgi:hypothetical protein